MILPVVYHGHQIVLLEIILENVGNSFKFRTVAGTDGCLALVLTCAVLLSFPSTELFIVMYYSDVVIFICYHAN
jgi:hypothetical protein